MEDPQRQWNLNQLGREILIGLEQFSEELSQSACPDRERIDESIAAFHSALTHYGIQNR